MLFDSSQWHYFKKKQVYPDYVSKTNDAPT